MGNFISNLSGLYKKLEGKFSKLEDKPTMMDLGVTLMDAVTKAKSSLSRSTAMYTDIISVLSVNEDLISGKLVDNIDTEEDYKESFSASIGEAYSLVNNQFLDFITVFNNYGQAGYVSGWPVMQFCLTLPSGRIINLVGNFDAENVGPIAYGVSVRYYEEFDEEGIGIGSHWVPLFTKDLVTGELTFNNLIADMTGEPLVIWDALSNLVENSNIVDNLYELSNFITGGETTLAGLVGLTNQWSQSKYQSVRSMVSPLLSAFKNGGVYGVANYIINFFAVQSTAEIDENLHLVFSDNNALVPAVYLTGLINTVGNSILSIGAAIALAGSKIVGLVVALVGGVVNFIGHVVSVDYNDTLAALNASADTCLSACPHAISQRTANIESVMSVEPFTDLNRTGAHAIPVPGGYLLFTIVDGTVKSEFHPDLVDRRACLKSFFERIEADRGSLLYSRDSLYIHLTFPGRLGVNYIMQAFDDITSRNTSTFQYPRITNDPETGRLSSNNDQIIRDIISFNMVIFMLFSHNYITSLGDVTGSWDPSLSTDWALDVNASHDTVTPYCNVIFDCYACVYSKCFPGRVYGAINLSNPWENIGYFATTLGANLPTNHDVYFSIEASMIIIGQTFYDTILDVPSSLSYAIMVPKYAASTFWLSVIVTGVIATAVIATTVVLTIAATKAINRLKLKNSLAVEKAYTEATENPTSENIKKYEKAVFKNNIMASIFGGTKYAKSGRWDDTSSSGNSAVSSVANSVKDKFMTSADGETGNSSDIMSIKALIAGTSVQPQ